MAFLESAVPFIKDAIPSVLSATSSIAGGVQARRAAEFQAKQAEYNAGQSRAASHLAAADQERRARLVASRAQAVAAASGAGASDPTVMDIISGIAKEGSYRSRLALYEGEDRARTLETQAQALRYGGRGARNAGVISGVTSLLKGGTSLYEKYGKGGPGTGYGTIDPLDAGQELDGVPY